MHLCKYLVIRRGCDFFRNIFNKLITLLKKHIFCNNNITKLIFNVLIE